MSVLHRHNGASLYALSGYSVKDRLGSHPHRDWSSVRLSRIYSVLQCSVYIFTEGSISSLMELTLHFFSSLSICKSDFYPLKIPRLPWDPRSYFDQLPRVQYQTFLEGGAPIWMLLYNARLLTLGPSDHFGGLPLIPGTPRRLETAKFHGCSFPGIDPKVYFD